VSRLFPDFSLDTTSIQLAAALNIPSWVMLGEHSDWRWQLEGETTPWYPCVRIFRAGVGEDWAQRFERVLQALEQQIKS